MFTAALACAEPALTIYNQNFAVIRESVPLNLKAGTNQVTFKGVTAYLEPESVTLRDPSGKQMLRILEQNYRPDPVSLEALLAAYEGKVIDFAVHTGDKQEILSGRIVRAGAGPVPPSGPYNVQFSFRPPDAITSQPIIEISGKLRMGLPGVPLFPALAPGTILEPAIEWLIHSPAAAKFDAELAYMTAGMSWDADYNLVQAADGTIELTGWVTISNRTGRSFENSRIKLMAGDVNRITRPDPFRRSDGMVMGGVAGGIPGGVPNITEKAFDEYHLYTLPNATTLLDKQTKQVEFVRASGVKSDILYVYDGAKYDMNRLRSMPAEALRMDSSFGAQSTTKVWAMREFVNSKANRLGMPLPKGKTRFYRRDADGQMEFTGEDQIDHTPGGEIVRVFTGAAFDLTGERRRTTNRIDHGRSTIDESFEVKVRNHKNEPVTVRVVEHLYRWNTWEITVSSVPFVKKDSDTVEFSVVLPPGGEKTVSYAVRYTW